MPRPRKMKATSGLLKLLPQRITDPTDWERLQYPGDDWMRVTTASADSPLGKEWRHITEDIVPWLIDDEIPRRDWASEPGDGLVVVAGVGAGLRRAVARFGPPTFTEPQRADLFFLHQVQENLVLRMRPDVQGMDLQPVVDLLFCIHALERADAEIRRREAAQPAVLGAWVVIGMRDRQERAAREHAGEAASPQLARLEEHEAAAMKYFEGLFAGKGEEGRELVGAMRNRSMPAVLGAEPAALGLEQFAVTLTAEWDHAGLSDFAILGHALDGAFKKLHWDIYRDLFDEMRKELRRKDRDVLDEDED